MPRTGLQTIEEIVDDVLEGLQEIPTTMAIVKNFIMKHAGMDQRTVTKYMKLMFETKHLVRRGQTLLVVR